MGFSIKNKPITWRRISQYYKPRSHQGIDLAAPTGTPVYATQNGTVVAASYGAWDRSYGNMVAIYHGNGTYTNHAHLSKIKVRSGQKVKAGQLIGLCGSTGRSTGPHLHFEIHLGRKWNRVNPKPYLDNINKSKKENKTKTINYKIGKTYTLLTNLNIRTGHSTDFKIIPVNKWSKNAKSHATSSGLLKKGTKITVKKIYHNKNTDEVWLKIPSGWICAIGASKKVYIQ